jgi:hypothetical protein
MASHPRQKDNSTFHHCGWGENSIYDPWVIELPGHPWIVGEVAHSEAIHCRTLGWTSTLVGQLRQKQGAFGFASKL